MRDPSWRFRTTTGTVVVHEDALELRSPPSEVVAGQVARLRSGELRDRARVVSNALVALVLGALLGWYLLRVATLGFEIGSPADVLSVSAGAVSLAFLTRSLYAQSISGLRIPLSAVHRLVVDEEARTLTVAHETRGGPLAFLREDRTERTLRFRTAEDVAEARGLFRLRRVPHDLASEVDDGETVFRFDTESGVCFCERCGSQVSPADASCPSCGYALRVERPVPADRAAG